MACSRATDEDARVTEVTHATTAATWAWALLAVLAVSLISLIGAISFLVRREVLDVVVPYMVSVAVGALLGTAFFHMIPDISGGGFGAHEGTLVIAGMMVFFLFERFVGFHEHGHSAHAKIAPYAWLNVAGNGLHNFADGLVLAAAWTEGTGIGLATTVAVALHEIPHELGDVGILLAARMSRGKAVLLNLATGLLALLGCAIGLLLGGRIAGFHPYVIGLSAGGFIYIAAADLIPELHRERRFMASALQVLCLLVGIVGMYLVK
jgi:zinc and cadmium transporter